MRRFLPWMLLAMAGGCSLDRFLPEPGEADAWVPLDDSGISTDFPDAGNTGDTSEPERDSGGRADVPLLDTASPSDADPADGDQSSDAFFEEFNSRPDVPANQFDAPPIIDLIVPATGTAAGGDLVVVEGDFFSWDTQVFVGGSLATGVDVVDRYTLAFFTPSGTPGLADVKLVASGGTTVAPDAFTYTARLRLDSVDPSSGPASGGQPVEVRGAGFGADTHFVFGTRDARDVQIVSSELATMLAPPVGTGRSTADVLAIGSDVAVLSDAYTWLTPPDLLGLVPPVVPRAGGIAVRVDGQGLSSSCVIRLDGRDAIPLVRSASGWFEFTAPGGPADSSLGASLDCGMAGSDYLPAALGWFDDSERQLAGVWPDTVFTSGGQLVTIRGVGLADVVSVTLGDIDARIVSSSDTSIEFVAPASGAATVDVVVVDSVGTLTLPDAFSWFARPEFSQLVPPAGPTAGGFEVELQGAGLDVIDAIRIDGVTVDIVRSGPASVVFTAPAGAGGAARVEVVTAGLVFDTGLGLTYRDELRFDAFTPSTAPIGGGTPVAIRGEGFDRACQVLVDGTPVVTTAVGSRTLQFQTPPRPAGNSTLGITGCGSGFTFGTPLRYINPSLGDGGSTGDSINGRIFVTVLDIRTGEPIAGATVMVQVRDSSPFVALTDAAGQAVFVDPSLVGPQTVTAFAEQRSTESFVGVDAERVTLLLSPLPPPECPPGDPSCTPPPPEPLSSVVGFLTGLDKLIDPPPGAEMAAVIETTRLARGFINPDPGGNTLFGNGPFTIQTRNGDLALIALCGYRFQATGQLVPLRMGVVRGLAQRPGSESRVTIDCSIELDQALTVKLTAAPALLDSTDPYSYPGSFRARLAMDFGGEGYFESLPITESRSPQIDVRGLPALAGPLSDVAFDVTAGAFPAIGNFPSSEAYVIGLNRFGVITMPELLAVPQFIYPEAGQQGLTDGYVEWVMDTAFAQPDFFYITATSPDAGFLRWALFVPGSWRSFHFSDFPDFIEEFGPIPRPGEPVTALGVSVRAIDVQSFDFNDFRRSALSFRNYRASSYTFGNFVLQQPVPPAPVP